MCSASRSTTCCFCSKRTVHLLHFGLASAVRRRERTHGVHRHRPRSGGGLSPKGPRRSLARTGFQRGSIAPTRQKGSDPVYAVAVSSSRSRVRPVSILTPGLI